MLTKEELKSQLSAMGILPTDTVLIHTSFKAVGGMEGGPDAFIDAFCEYLSQGLFLIPGHTWDQVTRDQPVYDPVTMDTSIGLIPDRAVHRPDGFRSLHPTHSIWGHGKNAREFLAGEEFAETPAPIGGAWWKLGEVGAKILLIGVTNSNNTYIHAVDEILDLPERLAPEPFTVTVRRPEGDISHPFRGHWHTGSGNFCNFENALVGTGAQTFGKLGSATVRIVDAAKCRDTIARIYSRTQEHQTLTRHEIPEALWE